MNNGLKCLEVKINSTASYFLQVTKNQHYQNNPSPSHLTDSTVETSLHMVLAFVTSVDKAVLTLVMQLHQHAHGAPLRPPQRAELQVFVPGYCQESITAIHEVTCHKAIRVDNRGQGICHGACNQSDHKEHLGQKKYSLRMGEMCLLKCFLKKS